MKVFRNSILTIAATSLLATAAHAGGFATEGINPGGALFNEKAFVLQGGFAWVSPQRRYTDATGTNQLGAPITSGSSTDAAVNYSLVDVDLKVGIGEHIDCALRGHEPWKLRNEVSSTFNGRFESSKFFIDSVGIDGTCSYSFDVGDGAKFRIIGGVRSTSFDGTRENRVTGPALAAKPNATVLGGGTLNAGHEYVNQYNLEDSRGYGYRVGAAYEIPQYLLRAQVIYVSVQECLVE